MLRTRIRLAAVLAYTDAMTSQITVPDDVFAGLREHFADREIVELTVTVGAWCGFRAGRVGDGRCGSMWQRPVRAVPVVRGGELLEQGLQVLEVGRLLGLGA